MCLQRVSRFGSVLSLGFLASLGHQSEAASVLGEYLGNQLSASECSALRVKDGYCFRKRQ